MLRSLTRIALFVAALSITGKPAAHDAAAWDKIRTETNFPLSGEFQLLDERNASIVAGSALADNEASGSPDLLSFGPKLTWFEGKTCANWRPAPWNGVPFDLHDPILSDMIIEPLQNRPNRRLILNFMVICEGTDLGSLTVIDRRVAIVVDQNGTTYKIVAMPLSEESTRRLQDSLKRERFYNGPTTGVFDDRTRGAVAAYAELRGAVLRFARPAMTQNLLEGLGVFDVP